jgi:pyruvate formate lyase activating enzyme
MYKFRHVPETPVDTLVKAREMAMEEGVRYVFVGNVRGGGYEDTVCHVCGEPVVNRSGYTITGWHLDEDKKCAYCGAEIPVVGQRELHRRNLV